MMSTFFGWMCLLTCLFDNAVKADILVIGGAKNDTVYSFKDQPARFGPDIPDQGLDGYLVKADPLTACEPVRPPPSESNMTVQRQWILLIKRGNCDFDIKVINAQMAGYVAAIVYNNASQQLIPMSGSHGDDVQIPSVFISLRDGIFLADDYLWSTGYYIVLTADYPTINLNAILLPFAIVVGICFFVLTMVLVAKYVRERRRRRRHRLPRSQLNKIAIRKYRKGDGNDVCAICLDEFEEGDKLRVLPCHHQYHCKCIDPWLLNNKRVCPVCKRKVIPGDSSDEEETVGQTATEPSESTPLLSSAHDLTGGPLENDLPVQQAPPLLINIEFLSDDEYDADTEDTHEKIGMVSDSEILIPSTSESSQKAVGSSSRSPGSPDLAKSAISVEENDVPLIRLSDSQDIAPPTDRS